MTSLKLENLDPDQKQYQNRKNTNNKKEAFHFQPLTTTTKRGHTKHPELVAFHNKYLNMEPIDAPSAGKGNYNNESYNNSGNPIDNDIAKACNSVKNNKKLNVWKISFPKPINLYKMNSENRT